MELIKKERYLSVEKMLEIYSAFQTLNSMLQTISLPEAELIDSTVTYNTSPADILIKMNAVEKNIQALHDRVNGKISGWKDKYYKKFQWTANVYDRKSEVYRWIDWINSLYTMLANVKIEFMPLCYKDGNNIYTSDNQQLYHIKRIYEVN